jgi:hypothetical protein
MTRPKVFVSYDPQDRGLAEVFLRLVRSIPVEVWTASQLGTGEIWSEVHRSRLRESDCFLLLLTPNARESWWVLQELGAAWVLGKRIIAIVTDRRLLNKLPVDLAGVEALTTGELDQLEHVLQRAA